MLKAMPSVFALTLLIACATPSGTYELKAYDSQAKPLATSTRMMAQGSGIYTVINALCINYPKANIIITDTKTGQELAGESPRRCP